MKNNLKAAFSLLLLLLFFQEGNAQTSSLVSIGSNGKLVYTPDSKGNVVPDFSGVGYRNSESSIPTIAVVKTVNALAGDNWTNVQNAINEVAALPLDSNGFRGTILFKSGTYELSNTINITASGIVLRGEGFDGTGTNFVATKTSQHTLFNFAGANGKTSISSSIKKITDAYLPIGKKQITVASAHTFVVGDKVLVHRIPNDAWISLLGMDKISLADPLAIDWVASAYDVYSERKVMEVNGNVITLDAPIMDIIDPVYSTGELMKYTSNRIEKCGIENLRISSYYASDTDELHGWTAISFANIANAWAQNIEVYYFGYSAVHITGTASWVTVDSCKMLDAKSIITGSRRYSFNVDGQRNLVTNCTTKNGRHDYVNGSRTCGPNVFYNNTSTIQNSDIGPHHRWSTGVLFDNIVGNGSQDVQNRLDAGSGHGWSGGQIMFWNCTAGKMILQDPPGDERNWAIGCKATEITNVGTVVTESFGTVESQGTPIAAIPSLFQAQLSERLSNLLSVKEINLLDENDSISIFPNSAKDSITIKRTIQMSSPLAITVYDATGQRVKILAVNQNQLSMEYSISNLNEGIYFVHFTAVDFSKTMKLVVKK
ncbi:T9SS type A sorting domain-containing protein [Flavobacterium cellulosilyticum]|nr:T9SS type A sorting domain-containing protein [Flavobacterium cellulosilyticum]